VAHEFARGIAQPLNPFLADATLTILPTAAGVAQTADVALSWLENAIGETGQMGMIHTTPAVGAALEGSGGYQLETRSGVLLTTANSTPVALDGGYIGTSPSLHPALAAGTDWMFATGPIQVRRNGDIQGIPEDIFEATDRATNEVTFMAERDYLVTWDGQLQAGVLVDWTP
jgi:hypothetical protein